jgi:hypothetical protein
VAGKNNNDAVMRCQQAFHGMIHFVAGVIELFKIKWQGYCMISGEWIFFIAKRDPNLPNLNL